MSLLTNRIAVFHEAKQQKSWTYVQLRVGSETPRGEAISSDFTGAPYFFYPCHVTISTRRTDRVFGVTTVLDINHATRQQVSTQQNMWAFRAQNYFGGLR